jgi:DNA-binding response OmpR family regulator
LRFNLQRLGFDVTIAYNGLAAIEQLKLAQFQLLITDYQMPVVNGEELCKAVREKLQIEHMPIIMCSAKGYEIDTARLITRYGVSRLIFKPFSMREISSLVEELISTAAVTVKV